MNPTAIEQPVIANKIIPIFLKTTDAINVINRVSSDVGIFKVKQIKVLTANQLTKYSQGLISGEPLLATDELNKITFDFGLVKNKPKIKNIVARTLAQQAVNQKARYNTDLYIDFTQSYFKLNTAISTNGWLLIQFTYEVGR